MDSDDSNSETMPVDVVFSARSVTSSDDLPMEDWSSLEILLPEENKKKILYNDGLYDPGSGEICGKYIAMSASSMFRHLYYNYPAITDPGIEDALLKPADAITYPDDGQALYLAICKEMNQCPVRRFYRGLLESRIDLRYYCINPDGFRAMAKALQYNKIVQVLNLTDNFLNNDACYHMGNMLLTNSTITEINLRGCRIGPQGAKRLFNSLHHNRTLKVLDLSYNKLGDDTMQHLAKAILFGLTVTHLNLSYNNINGKGAALLAESFETHNNFTHLDLSWNKISNFIPGACAFLMKLSESNCLQMLNLSWNSLAGPRISLALRHIVLSPRLNELNLSNNRLDGDDVSTFLAILTQAKKLNTLNLSYNPLSPHDALSVLNKVARVRSKVNNLLMENVLVNEEFLSLLEQTIQKKSKKNLVVTYGGIESVFKAKGPDARDLVLNRIEYITKKPKKNKTDIALIALEILKEKRVMNVKEFDEVLQQSGAYLDEDLVKELCNVFPGPPQKNAKIKMININSMVEYIKRKWPDRQLPHTPSPEPKPEPEPVPEPPKPTEKGKSKGKGKK